MTLKARLSALQAQAGSTSPTNTDVADPPQTALRQRLAQLRAGRVQAAPVPHRRLSCEALAAALNAEVRAPGLIRIEASLPRSTRIGAVTLEGIDDLPPLPGETEVPPSLYLDTETTGLAGGSGTLAFLVGLARVEHDSIRLTQFLMTRFDAEASLLTELFAALPADHRLVSYNGRTYDIPLLSTRLRMQGIRESFRERPHLDLLHPVRRLFAGHWRDCRLTTLERNLLGFARRDDLPGAEAPQAWFDYMRGGRAEKLIRVVAHNRQDILSLAAAHRALADAVQHPRDHELDLHGLGRWLAETSEEDALDMLRRSETALGTDGKRLLAHLLRRQGDWPCAVAIWESLAERDCADALERLAKYHEHVNGDPAAALEYCNRLPDSTDTTQRRQRLLRKLSRGNPSRDNGIPV